MADPFTPAFIAANCVWGAVKGLSGQAAVAGAKQVADALRKRQTPQNLEVLAATHAAFVRSIQLMADICGKSGGEAADQYSARALSKLAKDPRFADFWFGATSLPTKELNLRVRAIFEGANSDPALNAADAVIVVIEKGMGEPLTETHRSLFRNGSDKHLNWPQAFELFFADEVKRNEALFRRLAFDRLNEIVAFAGAHRGNLEALHERLARFQGEMHDRFDKLDLDSVEARETLARVEAMLSEQTGVPLPTLREIARAFGELQPQADAAAVESYLRSKAEEYHRYRERSLAIEARDNHSRSLLSQAQEAIDAGHFDEADRLTFEAEGYDAEISRELRLTADQRDIDRAAKRALRGDTAKLRGDYRVALRHYDEAVAILPEGAGKARFEGLLVAAKTAVDWGIRLGSPPALRDGISRLRHLLGATPRREAGQWGLLQNELARALHVIGSWERTDDLEEAVVAYDAALRVFTRSSKPDDWANLQRFRANALFILSECRGELGPMEAAVEGLHQLEEFYPKDSNPADWSSIQISLGAALRSLGERKLGFDGMAALLGAVAACRRALEVLSPDTEPPHWAITQSNLSQALLTLGVRYCNMSILEDSLVAARSSAQEIKREYYPFQWALIQNTLGNALAALGKHDVGTERLEEAIQTYDAALEVRQRHSLPVQWALTTSNAAATKAYLAERTGDCELARQAVTAFEAALEEMQRPGLAWDQGQVSPQLADARDLRDRLCVEG